jgi:probable F420-dependent oxidoreductase
MAGTISSVPVGFGLPQVFPDGHVDLALIERVARKAEALGYDSLWTQEQIVGQSQSLEPLALLSYLSAVTDRVRLGVSILVLPQRNPVQLAKLLATMDVLSGGRLTVGVGLGNRVHPAFGIPPERRVRRFTEVLEAMKALWAPGPANYAGELIRLDGVSQEPKPLQRPHPPLWFGSRTPAALQRAVAHGDGWMGAGSSTLEDFETQIREIRAMLERADRDPASFTLSKRLYVAIDDDADRAERRLQEWFDHNYNDAEMGRKVSVWGPAERVFEAIDGFIAAGAQHLLLNPVFDYAEHLDALARCVPIAPPQPPLSAERKAAP